MAQQCVRLWIIERADLRIVDEGGFLADMVNGRETVLVQRELRLTPADILDQNRMGLILKVLAGDARRRVIVIGMG
jgi:hypothetical protein